ncbi:MAG: hypothetical protein JOY80_11015 [Candidatus Dormibacteraeota bacterium]|nr:hypothetical protein [Candidatus Dormibacteraeota bacterium]
MISAAARDGIGPMERTRREIARAERVAAFRRTRISKARRRVIESDDLLDLIEECRLRDWRLVPSQLWGAVVRAVGDVDPSLRDRLGINRDPEHVADVLFQEQEHLLERVRVSQAPELAPIIPLFAEPEPAAAAQ